MKVVQANAPTSGHDDEDIEQFYQDAELAMKNVQTQNIGVIGDINAKVGGNQAAEQTIGNYGIDSRNARGEMLVEFAERNRLRTMNTFFGKLSIRNWTWQSPNGETRNEMDFILSDNPSIVQDVRGTFPK